MKLQNIVINWYNIGINREEIDCYHSESGKQNISMWEQDYSKPPKFDYSTSNYLKSVGTQNWQKEYEIQFGQT